MTADFTVRPARPADAPSLAELRWVFKQEDEVFHEEPDAAGFLRQRETWIADRLADGRWSAWVAEAADAICGHVSCSRWSECRIPGEMVPRSVT